MQKKIFNIFFFLFVFLMFNREFNLFGIDLRIIGFGIAFLVLLMNLIEIIKNNQYEFKINKVELLIFIFYILTFFCNIMWNFNGLVVDKQNFDVILISYIFNFTSFLVFFLNKKYFSLKNLWRNIFISSVVLTFSMFVANLGIDISETLFSGCRGYVGDLAGNFLGGKYRIAGYAEDPNYASLFMVIAFATNAFYIKKNNNKMNLFDFLYYGILIFGFLISSSKTIVVAIITALLFCNFKLFKKFKSLLIILAIFGPILFVVLKIDFFSTMITMFQRIVMWEDALDLFLKNPILGNGLTSFRSYFAMDTAWYVQCHSTVFQIISETGIICLIIFLLILLKNIKINNKYILFTTIVYTISMITTETVYHVYFIFIIGVLPMIIKELDNNEGKGNNICS